jgi:hypothetical protein
MDIEEFAKEYLNIELRPHQVEWLDFIINNQAVMLLAPRGHGKSTIMYCYIVWAICMDQDLRVLIASHKEELANTFSRAIQKAFELEPIQDEFHIKAGKPWRVDYFFFKEKRYPVVQTVAKQAGMTGGRYDVVIFDDLLTVENSRSEKRRVQLEEWINSEVVPALDPSPKRKEVIVGTRKNIEDWYSKLLEMPDVKSKVYHLYEMNEGKKQYLWPERFDEREEARLRARMEPDQFAREFMNEPIAGEGLRFKREWIEPYYYTSWQNEVPERFREIYIGIDPSLGSKDPESSYMALVVVVFDKRPTKQDIYVVDILRAKVSLAEQEDIIKAKIEEWNPTAAMIESVLVNKIFSERMMRQMPILQPVIYRGWGASSGLKGTTDVSKIGRIENIVGWLFKKGKIHLKDPKISPVSKMFIEAEYLQFPEGSLDMMDALNMAVDRIDLRAKIEDFKVWMY